MFLSGSLFTEATLYIMQLTLHKDLDFFKYLTDYMLPLLR